MEVFEFALWAAGTAWAAWVASMIVVKCRKTRRTKISLACVRDFMSRRYDA